MGRMRAVVKRLPLIPVLYKTLRRAYRERWVGTEGIFTEMYRRNEWGGRDSVSGTGSDIEQTKRIVGALPTLFKEFEIATVLDIPCGDFHWMRNVALGNIEYIGADIVKELIQTNSERYARDGLRFRHLDLIRSELPRVDLILCRDCLVHLSFSHIFSALRNVRKSGSEFLLTTTFAGRQENADIVTGDWRVLNLEQAPFLFPKPLRLVAEECTEKDGGLRDKDLGLWRIANLRECLIER